MTSHINTIHHRIYITVIAVLSNCIAYAEYDGRLADDPYHKSPSWLYLLIVGCIIYAIVRGLSNKTKSRNHKTSPQNLKKQSDSTPRKQYRQYGRYWDLCPNCKGSGCIDGKEVWFLVSPPESVCCDKCKGYGHQLTPEAERLHAEYLEQYNKEQAEAREVRTQRQKQREEEQKKIDEERHQKKHQAIADIKAAGRKILKEEEYKSLIAELRTKRKEKVESVMSNLKDEPVCTQCKNVESKKDCPVCRGTGHIPTAEANLLIDEIYNILAQIKELQTDCNNVYLPATEAPSSYISINNFAEQILSGTNNCGTPQSTLMRNKIVELLKDEPYCYSCMAAGRLKVRHDSPSEKAYEQIACSRCNGSGRLYYD